MAYIPGWVQSFPTTERAQVVALLEQLFISVTDPPVDGTTVTMLQVQTLLEDAAGIVVNPVNP